MGAALEKAGGTTKDLSLLGRLGGWIVFGAPDEASATAIPLSGGARGIVRTEPLRAFDSVEMDEVQETMRA